MPVTANAAPQKSRTVAGDELSGTMVYAATAIAAAAATGSAKFRRTLASVARRQAISGPMPLSSTSTSASGTV